MATLTNTQMAAILAGGGGIIFNDGTTSSVVNTSATLPTDAQISLAVGSLINTVPAGNTLNVALGSIKHVDGILTVSGRLNADGHVIAKRL